MQLKVLAGGLVLAAAIAALCDRAIHGPPELIVVWLLATLGVAIEGALHLRILAEGDQRLATAIVRPIPSSRHDCRD
jgi:hypothetical protein